MPQGEVWTITPASNRRMDAFYQTPQGKIVYQRTHDMIMGQIENGIKLGLYKPTPEDLKNLEEWHAEKDKRKAEDETTTTPDA